MSLVGSVLGRIARRRLGTMLRHANAPAAPQRRVLDRLLAQLRRTAFGREHGLDRVRSHDDLRRAVPLRDYHGMAPWWERARAGERDVVWPGLTKFWAISSGTTSGEKFLPVTAATIANNKRGGFDSLVPHLADGGGDLFGGKLLFLGGSTALRRHGQVWIGDNTGIMALHVPRCLRGMHAPDAAVRAMPSWERKVEQAAAQTADADLRMLAGVPSWIVLFGEQVLERCRAQGRDVATLGDVWPNLQLFVHGGVTFAPYAERCRQLIGREVRYTDTYSASEGGMLAVQDRREGPGMLPLLDRSTFFEFVPKDEVGRDDARRLAIDEVEPDVDYAVALTTDSGIVSYLVGDLVRFESTAPLRLVFAGRTAHTLNAFGEHVSGGELERAVAAAAAATAAAVSEFAVGVRYPAPGEPMGGHRYLVEFHREPDDVATFGRVLDEALQSGNEDYATHRTYGLQAPTVELLPAGAFLAFMRQRGKVGGQHKVPRLLDDRQLRELEAAFSLR
ncbi:MAG: GH3 auxin-responsive promoter family protein [Planctomycetes bacterium]|nr:GH3 auxin-responsive promoter family protein [Planctomycetota bacterium]